MSRTISAPAPAADLAKAIPTTWSFLNDMAVGNGTFVTGYNKKALARVRERFKAKGITLSVNRAEQDGTQGYTITRTA